MNRVSEMNLVDIDKLIPYVNNARTHSKEQINKLRASIREFGFINPVIMLMCHKVTHKNLIDSSPLFRYYLTHTPCNFFVKPIDSDTSEEI